MALFISLKCDKSRTQHEMHRWQEQIDIARQPRRKPFDMVPRRRSRSYCPFSAHLAYFQYFTYIFQHSALTRAHLSTSPTRLAISRSSFFHPSFSTSRRVSKPPFGNKLSAIRPSLFPVHPFTSPPALIQALPCALACAQTLFSRPTPVFRSLQTFVLVHQSISVASISSSNIA